MGYGVIRIFFSIFDMFDCYLDIRMSAVKQEKELEIRSPFPKVSILHYSPDLEFIIPGVSKPFNLSRETLAERSLTLKSTLDGGTSPNCRFTKETSQVEWSVQYRETETNEKYRGVLVKWLGFCCGENQTFSAEECPAALALLFQLQLSDLDELKGTIEQFMLSTAKENVEVGVKMLIECVLVFDECHKDETSRIDVTLARILFTLDNMKNHYDVIVEKCMMILPPEYLNYAEYSKEHDQLNEFNMRRKYVIFHDSGKNEIVDVFAKVNLDMLDDEELKQLFLSGGIASGVYHERKFHLIQRKLQALEEENKELKRRIERLEEKKKNERIDQDFLLLKKPELMKETKIAGKWTNPYELKTLCKLLGDNELPTNELNISRNPKIQHNVLLMNAYK